MLGQKRETSVLISLVTHFWFSVLIHTLTNKHLFVYIVCSLASLEMIENILKSTEIDLKRR